MGQPNGITIFALGCVGALAPEIIRLYKLRSRPWKKFSPFYLIISGIYAGLGGVVALVLPSVTVWAALYAGVTLPTLISTVVHHRGKDTVDMANERRVRDNIIKATDQSDRSSYCPPKSQPTEPQARARTPKAPGSISFGEFMQNHADGLFE